MPLTYSKLFKNREQAGKRLAELLKKYAPQKPIVLALPRGGVPVGFEIAKVLKAPLDVIVTRKLGAPGNKELGVGSIGEGDTKILDPQMLSLVGLSQKDLEDTITQEKNELARRVRLYRNNKPLPDLKNKTVILVDDGLATGVTAKAAIAAIKKHQPEKVILAAPVCPDDTYRQLSLLTDGFVCLKVPKDVYAIGYWYENFEQVSDKEVLKLLKQARSEVVQKM